MYRRSSAKFYRICDRQAQERPRRRADKPDWNPRNDWIVIANTHPSIITHETYQAVLARHRAGGNSHATIRRRGGWRHSPYLLSGLLRCVCGHVFTGLTTTKSKKTKSGEAVKTSYYVCSGYLRKGTKTCVRCLIPKEEMEALIWGMVQSRMTALRQSRSEDREGSWPFNVNEEAGESTVAEGESPPARQKALVQQLLERIEINPHEARAVVVWSSDTE